MDDDKQRFLDLATDLAQLVATSSPPVAHVLQFFAFAHLPPHLQAVSRIFADAAVQTVRAVPGNAELTVALRKMLEAKDAAVRAALVRA